MGFGPTTTGLRVRCATWLRHRPIKIAKPRVVINLKIENEIKIQFLAFASISAYFSRIAVSAVETGTSFIFFFSASSF